MFDNRDNDPRSSADEGPQLPPRPFHTFTPQQCADEVVAQLDAPEITQAIRNSVRCCIDSLPPLSCTAADIVALVSALRPLATIPLDSDGDNTLVYCVRSLLSSYLRPDISCPERQQGTLFRTLRLEFGHHSRTTHGGWAADLFLQTLVAGDIPLSPSEGTSLYRELAARELLYLRAHMTNISPQPESARTNKLLLEIGEILFDVVCPIEKEMTLLQPPTMNGCYSYVSCWLKQLSQLAPSKLPPLEAFDNDHTRYLLRESFRFFFSQVFSLDDEARIHHSYIIMLSRFFSSHIETLHPQPTSWFIPASEAYCLLCSLTLSREILSTMQALRQLATSQLLEPEGGLVPTSYLVRDARYSNTDFTISAHQLLARNHLARRSHPIREVTITDGPTTLSIAMWQDARLQQPSNYRVAIDFEAPHTKISLRGLTIEGLQAYISDGPLCLPTDPTTPEPRDENSKRASIFKTGDYLIPITVSDLQSILRLTTKAAAYLHPDYLVSRNHWTLSA